MDLGSPVARHRIRRPHEQETLGREADAATEAEQPATAAADEQPVTPTAR